VTTVRPGYGCDVADEPKREPVMYRPDPALALKAERIWLERRGRREFIIVGKSREGHVAETRLSGGVTSRDLQHLARAQRIPETARRVQ
jgi:hypothetical protein